MLVRERDAWVVYFCIFFSANTESCSCQQWWGLSYWRKTWGKGVSWNKGHHWFPQSSIKLWLARRLNCTGPAGASFNTEGHALARRCEQIPPPQLESNQETHFVSKARRGKGRLHWLVRAPAKASCSAGQWNPVGFVAQWQGNGLSQLLAKGCQYLWFLPSCPRGCKWLSQILVGRSSHQAPSQQLAHQAHPGDWWEASEIQASKRGQMK